jgi:hypothetical protein
MAREGAAMTQADLNLINDEEAFAPREPQVPRYRLTMFFAGVVTLGVFMNWIGDL